MTQDEIIELARQAGFWKDLFAYPEFKEHLEGFAKLVDAKATAKEREACAKVCDAIDKSHWGCEVKASWCSDAIRARRDGVTYGEPTSRGENK